MRPQAVKHHICPCCKELATVLVGIEENASFYRDDKGNFQYRCVCCQTTFSVDGKGKIITIKLRS